MGFYPAFRHVISMQQSEILGLASSLLGFEILSSEVVAAVSSSIVDKC